MKLILTQKVESMILPKEDLQRMVSQVQYDFKHKDVVLIPNLFNYDLVAEEILNYEDLCVYQNKAYNLLSFVQADVTTDLGVKLPKTFAIISDINTGELTRVEYTSIKMIDEDNLIYKQTVMQKYLPKRETKIMFQNGVYTMDEVARLETEKVLKWRNVGNAAIKKIQEAIEAWMKEEGVTKKDIIFKEAKDEDSYIG